MLTEPLATQQVPSELSSQNTQPNVELSNGKKPENDWATVTKKNRRVNTTESTSPVVKPVAVVKPGKIKFQSNKVVIIKNITGPITFNSDDKVRREIGKNFKRAIIERITRDPLDPKKLMIQLAREPMRDECYQRGTQEYV